MAQDSRHFLQEYAASVTAVSRTVPGTHGTKSPKERTQHDITQDREQTVFCGMSALEVRAPSRRSPPSSRRLHRSPPIACTRGYSRFPAEQWERHTASLRLFSFWHADLQFADGTEAEEKNLWVPYSSIFSASPC